ncbi:MAG: PQQ-binding-like beta-propeller repeat protein [Actinomycetota bacterium]
MPRRDLRALALVALLTAPVAGCSGGGDASPTQATAPTERAPAPRPPRTDAADGARTLLVVDGDSGRPVPGARVRVRGAAGDPLLQADRRGRVALPRGATAVRGVAPGFSPGTAAVHPGDGTPVLPLYDPRLQSPQYGGGPQRERFLPEVRVPPPSGAPRWVFTSRTLLEFPPAVKNGLVVVGTNSGRVYGLDARRGSVRWARHMRGNIAATPAVAGPFVIVPAMNGRVTAYRRGDGKPLWTFSTGGSPVETSPLVVGGEVYVGDHAGRLHSLAVRTGAVRWTYRAPGAIKGAAAEAGDTVIVGDYAGGVQAVRRSTGALVWRAAVGTRFYGGPAVSGGVAVIGDVGGAVVALDASTGAVRWRRGTGAYVYSSPAIARGTVFIGSYSGRFEALDLATGRVRWAFDAGGRISGSATVVGDVVYTARLARRGEPRRTWGLDTGTGAVRYQAADGLYSPVVAAGRTLYLVGGRTLSAFPARG